MTNRLLQMLLLTLNGVYLCVCAQSPVLLRRTVENSPISSCDTSDTESCSTLPVNSASLLRRTTNQKPSAVRGHVLKKAKEWEMKTGT
uniref:Secreted protein n=1 Tax=Hucho hucho TaxID=62062 RepID=A0A4W5KVC9_9TELE